MQFLQGSDGSPASRGGSCGGGAGVAGAGQDLLWPAASLLVAPAGRNRARLVLAGVVAASLAALPGIAQSQKVVGPMLREPLRMAPDRPALTVLEAKGWSFATNRGTLSASTLDELKVWSPVYADLAHQLGDDVKALRAQIAANKRPLFEGTDDNVGRVLDLRWLASHLASFRLVGVVNPTDRRDFTALTSRPSCGEVRLNYRLPYRFRHGATIYASRLPLNINAVFDVPAVPGDAPAVPCPTSPPPGRHPTPTWTRRRQRIGSRPPADRPRAAPDRDQCAGGPLALRHGDRTRLPGHLSHASVPHRG